MSGLGNFHETCQPSGHSRRRSLRPAVERLDQRALLSAGMSHALMGHPAEVRREREFEHNGTVVKTPTFYEDYTGPRLAELNVVAASGTLLRNGSFRFIGVNQGRINPNVTATYVFGIDRSGHLPTGPFPDRPDIRFDATVAIKIVPGKSPTVTVTDLANKTSNHRARFRRSQIAGRSGPGRDPGQLAPLNGPGPVAVPLQLLARGWARGLDEHRQLRPRVP